MSSNGVERKEYRLCEGVRARREAFGLLFYNSADTKMTFVRSRDRLIVERQNGFSRLILNREEGEDEATDSVLQVLLKKGLIVESRSRL